MGDLTGHHIDFVTVRYGDYDVGLFNAGTF